MKQSVKAQAVLALPRAGGKRKFDENCDYALESPTPLAHANLDFALPIAGENFKYR